MPSNKIIESLSLGSDRSQEAESPHATSPSIPLRNVGKKARRTPSQVQMAEQEALQNEKSLLMFHRLVNGIRKRQQDPEGKRTPTLPVADGEQPDNEEGWYNHIPPVQRQATPATVEQDDDDDDWSITGFPAAEQVTGLTTATSSSSSHHFNDTSYSAPYEDNGDYDDEMLFDLDL